MAEDLLAIVQPREWEKREAPGTRKWLRSFIQWACIDGQRVLDGRTCYWSGEMFITKDSGGEQAAFLVIRSQNPDLNGSESWLYNPAHRGLVKVERTSDWTAWLNGKEEVRFDTNDELKWNGNYYISGKGATAGFGFLPIENTEEFLTSLDAYRGVDKVFENPQLAGEICKMLARGKALGN
jgi:hypothetical protein